MLTVACKKCGAKLKVPDKAIGRKVRCAKCKDQFVVRENESKVSRSPNPLKAKAKVGHSEPEIEAAAKSSHQDDPFDSTTTRQTNPAGKFQISVDARQRVAKLDTIYPTPSILGILVAGIALSVYWFSVAVVASFITYHLIFNFSMLTGGNGSQWIMIPVFILILLVATGIFVVMLKPIRSRRTRNVARVLKPTSEPELVEMINQMADCVGSARPKRIEVDYEFRTSIEPLESFSDVSGENLYLRIGLPVVAGNSTEHVTTLLATKLGLYSKKHNSSQTIFVRNIVVWLKRTAFDLDSWDAIPQNMLKSDKFKSVNGPLAQAIKFAFLVIVRLPFSLLYSVTKILCNTDLKKQELNADAISLAIHGPETFKEFLTEHQNLDLAYKSALNDFVDSIEAKYAVNDVFDVMSLKRKYLNEFQLEDVKKAIHDGTSHSFESLNSDFERIEAIEKLNLKPSRWLKQESPLKSHLKCYPVLATQCTDDLRSYLKKRLSSNKGKRSSKTRRQRAAEIDRYIKSALREGIKSAE